MGGFLGSVLGSETGIAVEGMIVVGSLDKLVYGDLEDLEVALALWCLFWEKMLGLPSTLEKSVVVTRTLLGIATTLELVGRRDLRTILPVVQ